MTARNPGDPHSGSTPDEEPEEPIDLLAKLGEKPGPKFIEGVRNKIYRRETAAQLTEFSWFGLCAVAVEFARMITSPFASRDQPTGNQPNGNHPE